MSGLIEVLKHYNITGEVLRTTRGPLLNIIEFQPKAGTKLKNLTAVLEDIRRELGVASLRVGTGEQGAIVFEMPADDFDIIDFKAILNSEEFKRSAQEYALPLCLGVDVKGAPVVADLAKMPHLLVGGTTGSGKSVGLNTFILSLIAARAPADIKFVLIDPKKIEFNIYNNQKYLLTPVVTESDEAVGVLSWLAAEMDRRYELFAESMSKNLADYNQKGEGHLPYIVCVIDEFADLMALDKGVEKDVMRLAQKARAAGIHLILATQRPSVDVVTGVLKANFPTRLAYKVASVADSRTILDEGGAESLIGRGDSLFLASNREVKRVHGAYMTDTEIAAMLKPYAGQVKPLKISVKAAAETAEKPGGLKRVLRFWSDLRVKDRKMIIDALKYLFAFIAGFLSNNKKRK